MPSYDVTAPDGNVYEINAPEGATQEQVLAYAKEMYGSVAKKPDESVTGSLKKGVEQLISTGRTAAESLYKNPEEAALAGQKREEEISKKYGEGVSLDKLKKVYQEKGLLSAAGELAGQIPKAVAEQLPNIGTTVAGAGAGAALGSVVPGVGTILGGVAGAALPSFIQQYGGNIQRQAQAQQEEGKPLDISRTVAAGTAIPQTALDVAQTFIPFGGKIAGKVFGPAVGKLLGAGEGAAAEKLAKEGLMATIAKGTATGVVAEIPTEVTQQMLERAQAGLSLTDQDALNEYGSTAFAVSLLGPLGILGRVSNKAEAGRTLAEAQAVASQTNEPQTIPLQLTYDPSIPDSRGTETFVVFPDGRIAPSEPAAFAERYKSISTIPSAEEEAQLKPFIPAEAFAKSQPVAMLEKNGAVKIYEGVPNKGNTGINLLDENKKVVDTIKPDSPSAIINPTEQDIFKLETKAMEKKLPQMRQAVDQSRIEANKTDKDFKQFIKDHPIQSQYYADVINPKHNRTRLLTKKQHKDMFINSTDKGYHLDDLAAIAHENGYLSDAEFNNTDDVGGVNAFIDKIAQAYDNQTVDTAAAAEARARYQALDAEYKKLDDEVQARKEQVAQYPTEEEEISPDFVAPEQAAPIAPATEAAQAKYEPVTPSFRAEVATPFADKFIAEEKKLTKQLRSALDRMGLKNVGLKLEDSIREYVNGEMSEVNGVYFNKLIKLSLSGDNMFRTMSHEALHAMKELGFFSPADWAILEAKARSEWMEKYDIASKYGKEPMDVQLEEAIAYAFADHNKQLPVIKRIMNAAVNALKSLGNVFRGSGYRKAEDIFKEAAAGKLKSGKAFKNFFDGSKVVNEDGSPKVVYHGTDKEDFSIFDPASWFTDNATEAGAYSQTDLLRNRERLLGKYKLSDDTSIVGERIPFASVLSDIGDLEVGKYYAEGGEDGPVYKYLGKNKFEVLKNVVVDLDSANLNDMTIGLKKGHSQEAVDQVNETKEYAKTFEGGEGGRIYPVYLSIKNPIYLDAMQINGFSQRLGKSKDDIKKQVDEWKSQGYDGIITTSDEARFFPDVKAHLGGVPNQYIPFDANQIKSAIGNKGTFDAKNPDIRAEIPSKAKLKTALHGVDPDYAQKILDQFTQEPVTVKEKMENLKKGFFDRMVTGLFDEFHAIKKYTPEGYMMARLSKSIDGGLQGLLEYGHVFNDGGALQIREGTKGLLKILKPLGAEVDQYQIWKALNRDANMSADRKSFDKELVAGRDKLAAGNLNGRPRKAVYEQALREENELNKSVLKVALDAGIIDKNGYDTFSKDIYYIPFYKVMEDGDVASISESSKLTGQQFSKMLKGGEKKTNDLMENVLMNWSHILSAAMKNQAATNTIDAAEKMGAAEIATQTAGKYPPGTVKVMRDGEVVHYTLTDPDLVDAISTISYLGPKSAFLDVAKGFTNALRYGITMSPAYKIRNLMRDSVQSAAISDLSSNLFSNVYNGLSMSKEGHPTFMAALAGGGIFEMGVAHEGNQAKLIRRLIDKGVSETTILDSSEKIKSKLQSALDYYNEIGNKFENANRLALYQKLIDSGKNHLEASYAARDLMDFSMQGQFRAIKVIGSVVPFFNARLQGLYKLGRDGVSPTYRVICNATTGKPLQDGDKMKAAKFTTISSAVMLASMALYGMYKDDEDFKRREPWDRDNFWWFKIGDTQFRIPRPFEIGALGTIAERTYEQISDEGVEGKVFGERMQSMLANTFSMNPMPQMIKPMIDLYANTDSFTGAPIESAGMERLSKQERKTNHTSGLAIALGGVSKAAAQVLTMNPQAEGFSPIQMDYGIKAYFGWLGATAASTADLAVEPFQEGTKVHKPLIDTLAMGFVKTMPETQSRYMTDFYQNNANLQSTLADMRHYAELGDQQKVIEIMQEKGNDLALAKVYDTTSKRLAEIRKAIRMIEVNQNIPADERRAEMTRLQIIMSDIAKQMEETRISLKK